MRVVLLVIPTGVYLDPILWTVMIYHLVLKTKNLFRDYGHLLNSSSVGAFTQVELEVPEPL